MWLKEDDGGVSPPWHRPSWRSWSRGRTAKGGGKGMGIWRSLDDGDRKGEERDMRELGLGQ